MDSVHSFAGVVLMSDHNDEFSLLAEQMRGVLIIWTSVMKVGAGIRMFE